MVASKILKFDLPISPDYMQRELDRHINNGYVYIGNFTDPKHSQVHVILYKYTSGLFSGPYTFNLEADY